MQGPGPAAVHRCSSPGLPASPFGQVERGTGRSNGSVAPPAPATFHSTGGASGRLDSKAKAAGLCHWPGSHQSPHLHLRGTRAPLEAGPFSAWGPSPSLHETSPRCRVRERPGLCRDLNLRPYAIKISCSGPQPSAPGL